jgi:hypothetical protein
MGEKGIHDYPGDIVNEARIDVLQRKQELTAEEQAELDNRLKFRDEGMQKAKLFPASVREHSIFNFQNLSSDALFWLLMFKLGKDDPERVERILTKLFDGILSSMKSYSSASAANRITAWGAGRLNSLMLERFGLITRAQACDFASGISIIAGMQVVQDLASLLPWTALGDKDDGFPDQLTIAGTEYKLEEKVTATPISRSEVGKSITLEKKEP